MTVFSVIVVSLLSINVNLFLLVTEEALFPFTLFIVIFGDPQFQVFLGQDGSSPLLMTVDGLPSYFSSNKNQMLVLSFTFFSMIKN